MYSKYYPEFITVTCLNWKWFLEADTIKDIIIESLQFLTSNNRITVYSFVIMQNHMHLIWQIRGDRKREDVQRDFLKYTGQRILKKLRDISSPLVEEMKVGAKDRKYQIWERNSLSISLESHGVFIQKLEYIHNNPVSAGICSVPWEYKYSSSRFYDLNERDWGFVTHYEG